MSTIYKAPPTTYLISYEEDGKQIYVADGGEELDPDTLLLANGFATMEQAIAVRDAAYPDATIVEQPKPAACFYRVDDSGTLVGFFLNRQDAEQSIREYPHEVDWADGRYGEISLFLVDDPDSVDGIDLRDHEAIMKAWEDSAVVNSWIYVE